MFLTNFLTIEESIILEQEERQSKIFGEACTYSNTFLDDNLGCIASTELVVVGADTGVGKSEFVLNLAFENAIKGKIVHLFSLEGAKNEAISRLRWKMLCQEYFKKPDGRKWTYKDYLTNKVDLSGLEKADEKLKQASSLNIYNNNKILSLSDLVFELGRIVNSDLIILDHLHYLSLDESQHETSQISGIVRMIKEITKVKRVPIVLVSHLRKKDRFRSIPDNEDFHGSSNIAKEADTCIMIFKDSSSLDYDDKSETCFRVAKSRYGSDRRFIGVLDYDLQKREYNKTYSLKKITAKGSVPVVKAETPSWAKNCEVACQQSNNNWGLFAPAEDE